MTQIDGRTIQVSVADVVTWLRIEGGFADALSNVVRRRLLLQAADEAGITASAEELQRAADAWRALRGLHKASDTHAWLAANGVSTDTLEGYLEENIRISKARDHLAEQHAAAAAETPEVKNLIRELSVEAWLTRKLAE